MIQVIQLILALSFLVLIHEMGHFAFARLFHVRVEKFYMFFNYRFSLFRAKKFDGRWHVRFCALNTTENDEWSQHPDSTEWGIGWIPFGGYCAIAGMVDETHTSEQLTSEPQPWEFRAKNVWQRLLIISGGIMVNFVAALIIFSMVLYHDGTTYLPLKNVTGGLYFDELLLQEGFEQQDRILRIDDVEPETLSDVVQWIIINGHRNVTVLRGQDTVQLRMSEDLGTRYLATQNEFDRRERDRARKDPSYQKNRYNLTDYYYPFVIDSVFAGTAAERAGLMRNDSLTAINDVPVPCYALVSNVLRQHRCDSVTVTYYRQGQLNMTRAFINDQGKLGIITKGPLTYYALEHKSYTLAQSIPLGISHGWEFLMNYIKQFRLVFTREGAKSMGGFGAIGQMFPSAWNWSAFWTMTAILSIVLAFMNFLPIPALDGGYILFLLYEMVTGHQPSDKFLETVNKYGSWIVLALLIWANGNDILKWLFI